MARRKQRWNRFKAAIRVAGMVAGFVVLTAGSLGMALSGNPIGWAGLLLFGGGGVFMIVGWAGDRRERHERRQAPPQAAAEPERWPPPPNLLRYGTLTGIERYAAERHGVLFPSRRSGQILPVLGGLLFTGIGVTFAYVAFHSSLLGALLSGAIALACVGFFFPLTVAAALRLFSPAGGILALPEGIYLRIPQGTAWLPWPAVSKIAIVTYAGQPSIAFTLKPQTSDNPDTARLSGPLRVLRPVQRRWFREDIAYPGMSIALRPDLAATILDRLRRDPEARARLGDPAALMTLDPDEG